MADETYAPKPLPPEPVIHWPTRLGWTLWSYLSWPWQVRQLKAAGFRRVGWMTWETGPPEPPRIEFGEGQLFIGPVGTEFGSEGWQHIGAVGGVTMGRSIEVTMPQADPSHNVNVRACQGISPAVAAELAEGIRRLADDEVLANSPLCPVELEELPPSP
jgi:hypothetical protein